MSEHTSRVRVNYEIGKGFSLYRKVCTGKIHVVQTRIKMEKKDDVFSTRAHSCDRSCKAWSNTYIQEMSFVPKEILGILCGSILGTTSDPLQLGWAIVFTDAAVDFVF